MKAMKLPKGWSRKPLASLVHPERKISYGIVQPGDFEPNGILLVRGQDYSDGWAKPDSMFRVSEAIDAPYRRSRLKAGDIVMTIVGAGTGNIAIVPDYLDGANITQTTARIAVNKTVADRDFIRLVLESHVGRHEVYRNIKGGAQPGLNIGDVEEFQIPTPPLSEQCAIAITLMPWISALEKLDALIAAKGRRKQALMQQLLHVAAEKVGHGHTRVRLGDVVERVTRKNTVGNENVLTISAQEGLINQHEYFNRSVAGADLSGYFLLRRGEFAYNRSSSIGFPYGAIKRLDRYDAGIVSTLYLCFRTRDAAEVSSDYLTHYLDGGFLNAGLRSIAKEGARAHGLLNVTADEFFDLDIFLPPMPLQEKIAAVLDAADAELRLLREQRVALDQQKRGLMQQLLTGKRRVST